DTGEDAHFSVKDDSVDLSDEMTQKATDIAAAYFKDTGEDLVVTDGGRDATDQAARMFDKLENGEDLTKLYKDQDALKEITDAYDKASDADQSDEQVKQALADVIQRQMDDDVYISRHLEDNAFDVRSKDMTPEQQQSFKVAVEAKGGKVIVE